ncbi:BCD family MFS transporter [Salinarimonas soli]|uniref:BCD family MFS transporter n=1 Tax=Salinarimonas soli TaxID=1638099 RepID=A0A5B2VGS3_9HYPH|nr:BCD family MFS transporter [Salinarimonas soli]KAA2238084.1 BCD family MFS transporter [Salinarimonas soli]
MSGFSGRGAGLWTKVGTRFLPFADAATPELPLSRLLRLSLFQVSTGIAVVLLNGTLNRVMIVELGVATWLVSLMVSLPLIFAPLRALVGFRSDHHRSVLGWKRVPYIWFGTLMQFGGLAIMPFALLLLSGDTTGPAWIGHVGAALAFLLVGAGLHTAQTAGLALATDLATDETRPRIVAFLYVMLLVGMVASGLVFGELLDTFSQLRLIQVIQGAAILTMGLNLVALWKQEARDPSRTRRDEPRPSFRESWRTFLDEGRSARLLVVVALGTAGCNMQDILLEPFGAAAFGMSVGQTTALTALLAGGTLAGFGFSAARLGRGGDPYRLAALGALAVILAMAMVIMAPALASVTLFRAATAIVGFGTGLFMVGTMIAAMALARTQGSGLALGAWGAVQATAVGTGIAVGGFISDVVGAAAASGALGEALADRTVGFSFVYHLEILLLFATLVALGPLVRPTRGVKKAPPRFGLDDVPA